MANPNDKTINYYDKNAYAWAVAHHGFEEESFWKDWMDKFHKLLPSGKVLEIGSGSGKDALNLIKLGYDYVGTDASKGFLKLIKERLPNTTFINVRAQDLTKKFKSNQFDGFWSAATLLHVPKDQIEKTLAGIHKIVKVGGIGFVSMRQGEGEKEDETGRLFSNYTLDKFAQLLNKNGFEILEKKAQPASTEKVWLIYLVRSRGF